MKTIKRLFRKNILKIGIFAIIIIKSLSGQAQWGCLNTGCKLNLYSVACLSENTVIVCGDSSTILKTTDGGLSWTQKNFSILYELHVVRFANKNIGYIGGKDYQSNRILLKTTDGGETWTKLPIGDMGRIDNIFLIDADSLYIMNFKSGKLMKSTNGGNTWKECLSLSSDIKSFFFKDNIGYIASINRFLMDSLKIYKTENFGNSWEEILVLPNNAYSVDMYFSSKDTGEIYMVEMGFLYSSDGFNSYRVKNDLVPLWKEISGEIIRVKYLSNQMGCILSFGVTTNGECFSNVFKTEDRGKTWYNYFDSNSMGSYEHGDAILYDIDGWGDSTFYISSESGIVFRTPEIPNRINILKSDLNVKLFPNPCNNQLTIENKEFTLINGQIYMKELYIYDVVGKEVKHFKGSNTKITVSVGDLCPGVYMVKVLSEDGIAMKKFVKE